LGAFSLIPVTAESTARTHASATVQISNSQL
jgi:hypothetical protein